MTENTSEETVLDETSTEETIDDSPSAETLSLLDGAILPDDDSDGAPVSPKAGTEEQGVDGVPPESTGEKEPAQDKRFSKAFTALSKREKEVTQREAELKRISVDLQEAEEAAGLFKEDPVNFLRKQLAVFHGSSEDADIDAAIGDLYNSLTMHVLGVDAPKEMQADSEYQKLKRDFDNYKKEQQTERQRLEEEQLELQKNSKIGQAKANIKAELIGAKEEFPFLLSQDEQDPGELVWELVWQDYNSRVEEGEEDPTPMTVAEAAAKANAHFQSLAQKWASLIPKTATNTKTQPTGQTATNRPGSSRTLTNSKASVVPSRDSESKYIDDDEESKLRAMELLRIV